MDSCRAFRCIDCDAIRVIDTLRAIDTIHQDKPADSTKMFIFFNRTSGYNHTICGKCRHNYKFVQHIYAITSPDFLQLYDNCENIAFIHEVSYCARCGLTACSRCPVQFDEQTRGNIAMKICSYSDDCERRGNKCEKSQDDEYFSDNSNDYSDEYPHNGPAISR